MLWGPFWVLGITAVLILNMSTLPSLLPQGALLGSKAVPLAPTLHVRILEMMRDICLSDTECMPVSTTEAGCFRAGLGGRMGTLIAD